MNEKYLKQDHNLQAREHVNRAPLSPVVLEHLVFLCGTSEARRFKFQVPK